MSINKEDAVKMILYEAVASVSIAADIVFRNTAYNGDWFLMAIYLARTAFTVYCLFQLGRLYGRVIQ